MRRGVLAAVACAMALGGFSEEQATHFAQDAWEPFLKTGELPGAISVFYDDGREEIACFGYADVEAKRKITLDDPFQQCSQTKGFCGVTAAMLVEAGKIRLDDSVSCYLPEFENLFVKVSETNGVRTLAKAKNKLTVRMCLNHTGGLPFEVPNFHAMGGWSRRMPLRSVAAVMASEPLLFEPGTKVQYSNAGIDIAAAVVEQVSGMRWETFLEKRVFKPLGMTSSTFWPTEDQVKRRIGFYRYAAGKLAVKAAPNPSMQPPFGDDRVFPSAGAGLWTTARDQLKFYKMLMNLGLGENGVRLLKEETVRNLLAKSSRPAGFEGYSLGLIAPVEDREDAWFGHGGAWANQCLVNWHRKQLQLLVVQLTGGNCYAFRERNAQAAEKFFKTRIDQSGVEAYTGRLK